MQVADAGKRKLNQITDYEQIKALIQKSQSVVASYNEFAVIKNRLQEAEQELESEHESLQKRLQDMRTMQSIRQYTLVKANTVYLCEEAIKAIKGLLKELKYQEEFTNEVNKLLYVFGDKVATYNKSVQNLHERIRTVETSKQLSSIRDEYAKLEFIFKDSTEYSVYQQLEDKISLLGEDLERISNLENYYQQSNSIASCDRALEIIGNEQKSIHDLDRFRPKLLQLEDHLSQRRQSYSEHLNELHGKLGSLKTRKEAQKLQKELADASAYYRKSQEEKRYEATTSEVSLLTNLLQISETQKVDTVQACQAELERLLQWRDTTEGITPTVQTLLESMLAKLEQTQQRTQDQQRNAARLWLKGLENQDIQLDQSTDPAKTEVADKLLRQIRKQRSQHEEMLQEEQKQILKRIINHCLEIQNQNTESKIIALFRELPFEQREGVLKTLAEDLSRITEEF